MGQEIERRYLVADHSIVESRQGVTIVQGYVSPARGALSTRIRIGGSHAWLTLKSRRQGLARDEYEYPIPLEDATEILERHCVGRTVRKTRYNIPVGKLVFEVDVFGGALTGLVIAEVEVSDSAEVIELPSWIGPEISGDKRYGNKDLALIGHSKALVSSLLLRQSVLLSEQSIQLA